MINEIFDDPTYKFINALTGSFNFYFLIYRLRIYVLSKKKKKKKKKN
jgi:hypothetical protein